MVWCEDRVEEVGDCHPVLCAFVHATGIFSHDLSNVQEVAVVILILGTRM